MSDKKDVKHELDPLARLDLRKPDDIIREERARLEAIVAKQPPGWWKDYSETFYGRLREPSRFPTILLGIGNMVATSILLLWSVTNLPMGLMILSLAVLAGVLAAIGAVEGGEHSGPHGWALLRNLFFPFTFFITLKEWRAVKKLRGYAFDATRQNEIHTAKHNLTHFSPAAIIRNHYVAAVTKLRVDVLGPDAKMTKTKGEIASQLHSARSILGQLEQRSLVATASKDRIQLLKQGIKRAKEREQKLLAVQAKHDLAIKKAEEFLKRCMALAEGMDGAIGDLELIRKLDGGIEEDKAVMERAEEAVGQMVGELYTRMVGLQAAASSVARPVPTEGGQVELPASVDDEFAEYERLAEQVLALDVG